MPLTFNITTEPATEPITRAEAKAHLRVDATEEDTYIDGLITAARVFCESHTDRQFITATYTMRLDEFPKASQQISVPRPNLLTVTSIAYLDSSNVSQTLATADYQVDIASLPGRLMPAYGLLWPVTYPSLNAVTIVYTAGYGAAGTAVPAPIKHAIKLLVSHMFENREPIVVGTITSEIPMTVKSLLGPYRAGTVY